LQVWERHERKFTVTRNTLIKLLKFIV
jgi:hypothetical protein